MIKVHGPFTLQPTHEKMSDGWPALRNADGDSWHEYVFNRVRFDGAGQVIEFFDEDGVSPITVGKRKFGHVIADDPNGEVHWVTDNITKGDPIDRIIIETTRKIEVGMRYLEGKLLPPLPAPTIQVVTARQAKIVLSRRGLLASADVAILAMDGQAGEEARIEWQYATRFERNHPLIASLGAVLNLTTAEIDELFVEAGAI